MSTMWFSHRTLRKTFYLITFIMGIWLIVASNNKFTKKVQQIKNDNDEVLNKETMVKGDQNAGEKFTETKTNIETKRWENVVSQLDDQNSATNRDSRQYVAEWFDLNTRPLPEWYDRAKIGIMVHWGVYSVPAFQNEYFWMLWKKDNENIVNFMKKHYPPGFTYAAFATLFKANYFNPSAWATLFRTAGARYVVLTSKHHDGYALFPSKQSPNWNSAEVGPRRDIVGELSKAVREKGLEFGVHYSLFEWHNPIYNEDKDAHFSTYNYRDNKMWPEFKQLINDYKPSVIRSDGDFEAKDTYWNSTKLLAWLYNESPVRNQVVVNDRWGRGLLCKCGDFHSCFSAPSTEQRKWENAFSLDAQSWGFRRDINLHDVLPVQDLIKRVIKTVSNGGNVLINLGAKEDGTIPLIFQERLLALGEWLAVNAEAIFETSPWFHQGDSVNKHVWYTCKNMNFDAENPIAQPEITDNITAVYAMFTSWPRNNVLKLKDISVDMMEIIKVQKVQIQILDYPDILLNWTLASGGVRVSLPNKSTVKSDYAWALKINIVAMIDNNTVLH